MVWGCYLQLHRARPFSGPALVVNFRGGVSVSQTVFSEQRPASRVLVVEGQALLAKMLVQTLRSDTRIEVVGEARALDATKLRQQRPDIIIVDIDDAEIAFAEFVATARRVLPPVRICVLTELLSVELMKRCLDLGADAYIVKDILPSDFIDAVTLVAGGEAFVDPRIAGRLLRLINGVNDSEGLSFREAQIVRLIVEGLSNKEIASALYLSERTIKNHVSRIFAKLNCSDRTQVAVYALRSSIA